ncbi:DUF4145 domain-containing protein [Bradyrhizobium sp. RDT10]
MADEPTKDLEQIRGHCPNCGPDRFADVVAEYRNTETLDSEHGMWATTESRTLRCGGCKAVYFQEVYTFSEDYDYEHDGEIIYNETITYYPAPAKRTRPEWLHRDIDGSLYDLLDETYNALNVDARVLAATGARTIFDRASELLGIDPAITFSEKLDLLLANGHIGTSERGNLDLLTDAGGAAAHRGWKPTLEQLNTVMSILEAFIYRAFVLDAEVKKLKTQIPPRQKREKKKPDSP